MSRARLMPCALLDARRSPSPPIVDAANIPADDLPSRLFELPPRMQPLWIADTGSEAAQAAGLLRVGGRDVRLTQEFSHVVEPAPQVVARLWSPSEWLAHVAPKLPAGRALDVACGCGRDAVYLASLGWEVFGVDVLPDAIAQARGLAERCAAAIASARFEVMDLEQRSPPLRGVFELIHVSRYLHRPLIPRLIDLLDVGGLMVYETFTTAHREKHGKPARDAHVLAPGELPMLMSGLRVDEYDEDWRDGGAAHTARIVARKETAQRGELPA